MYAGDEYYGDDVTSGFAHNEDFIDGVCGWCEGIGDLDGCPNCGLEYVGDEDEDEE